MKRWRMTVVFLAVFCGTVGCVRTLESKAEFETRAARVEMGQLYYVGSSEEYHFFIKYRLLKPKLKYRISVNEMAIEDPMEKTSDLSSWRPYVVNINEGTRKFIKLR